VADRPTTDAVRGTFVTETLAVDGGRQVTAYVHGGGFWREEFPRMVAWAFGPTRSQLPGRSTGPNDFR